MISLLAATVISLALWGCQVRGSGGEAEGSAWSRVRVWNERVTLSGSNCGNSRADSAKEGTFRGAFRVVSGGESGSSTVMGCESVKNCSSGKRVGGPYQTEKGGVLRGEALTVWNYDASLNSCRYEVRSPRLELTGGDQNIKGTVGVRVFQLRGTCNPGSFNSSAVSETCRYEEVQVASPNGK